MINKNGTMTIKLNWKPATITKALLAVLSDRARDIVERRYGLTGTEGEGMTLEAIGQIYGITRERVRQIENFATDTIRKSDNYAKAKSALLDLEDLMANRGGLVKEETFLNELSKDKTTQNHINFLLNIGDSFVRIKEDDHFHHRWTTDEETSEKVHSALHSLHESLSYEDLVAEAEMLERFSQHLAKDIKEYVSPEQAKHWLGISKHIGANPLGEWGLADSPNIKVRGMRDYAYLVLRNEGKPLHFTEVAKKIEEMFDRKAHVATTHNELIKDSDRFVLVGRGLYALSEWGYTNGIVREVISSVLKKGPMTKEELVKEVLKQRQVKENTIYVNLQNPKYFKKDPKGRYALV
ncbi:MAG TPA: sigma factor-like helix-turn-helix DNA-binding protein [Candidatus Paceibacterota bacterium]